MISTTATPIIFRVFCALATGCLEAHGEKLSLHVVQGLAGLRSSARALSARKSAYFAPSRAASETGLSGRVVGTILAADDAKSSPETGWIGCWVRRFGGSCAARFFLDSGGFDARGGCGGVVWTVV